MPTKIRLTPRRICDFPNPKQGKSFLWDNVIQGLGVLASPKRKNYVFEGRFAKKSIRITIGNTSSWTIEDARKRATELRQLIDNGLDPRLEKKRTEASEKAERQEMVRQDVTLCEAWPVYMKERQPNWSTKYYTDHERIMSLGGEEKKRGKGETVAGPLASLANHPLTAITPSAIKKWLTAEQPKRPTETRRAFEMLRTFLNWCETDNRYRDLAALDACSAKIKKDNLAKKNSRDDALQREQLTAWFDSVLRYENKILSAYVQMLLLTGARREELLSLTWSDVDFRWQKVHILGKGAVPRDIPLTPYVSSLLSPLPRRNQWVFSSTRGKDRRLQSPTKAFQKMMARAEIDDITLHGLRRSFSTLSEWLETPVGIVYQIQGHMPSATAEKHYKKRPIDLLRKWHTKIETWILEQAGIAQPNSLADIRQFKLVARGND
jgi:integrase